MFVHKLLKIGNLSNNYFIFELALLVHRHTKAQFYKRVQKKALQIEEFC